jgi:thioredoxin 1
MNPILERIADSFPQVAVAKVNVDENNEVTAEHAVGAIPTLLFFKGGELVKRVSGLQTEASLKQWVENFLIN